MEGSHTPPCKKGVLKRNRVPRRQTDFGGNQNYVEPRTQTATEIQNCDPPALDGDICDDSKSNCVGDVPSLPGNKATVKRTRVSKRLAACGGSREEGGSSAQPSSKKQDLKITSIGDTDSARGQHTVRTRLAVTQSQAPAAVSRNSVTTMTPVHRKARATPAAQQLRGRALPIQTEQAKRTRNSRTQAQLISESNSAASGSIATPRPNKRGRPAAPKARAKIGLPLPKAVLQLPVPTRCTKCRAKLYAYESKNLCCNHGAVRLPTVQMPQALVDLYTGTNDDAIHFRKYARIYNNLFAFSSIGGQFDAKTVKGIYVFKLQGQIYHNVPDLLPSEENPKYLQLYFYDGQHEAENRAGCFTELRQSIIDILIQVTADNPYARFFRSLQEINVTHETQIVLCKNPKQDQRVYNPPTCDEVAAIWPDRSGSTETDGPYIVVRGTASTIHRIRHYYGCYDPLQYPLLFPNGETGWHPAISKAKACTTTTREELLGDNVVDTVVTVEALLELEAQRETHDDPENGRRVSCRSYYCYKLQNRPSNLMLRAGRCLQQYIVDMYVKIENTRLDFLRNNQTTIRAELYQGVLDTIDAGETCAANVGRRVILPPTYIGGPRDMRKRYLNAMALVQRFGKPDLFITMTCNVNWPEIKSELAPGEEAQNRPDIVSRVFRAKLVHLRKQIMEKHIFGEVSAFIYVVEFQKRGLPHAHLLIILKPSYKLKSPADFDTFVSAEIPGPEPQTAALRSSVLKHMMHGPCGDMNPLCPCMTKEDSVGKCKSGYPKTFAAQTTNNADGYPMYRRRPDGVRVKVRRHMLDNRWVIPYNPYLLALFDCHLNVEVCSTIQAVKYLYKYVYKGHDKIGFDVAARSTVQAVDEIEQYQSGRWVSPCEAIWRIFSFPLFEMHPPVLTLPVHLLNMQTLHIRGHENLSAIALDSKRSKTALTEYFTYNASVNQHAYSYSQFPEHFRWDVASKTWVKRKTRQLCVGRVVFVLPSEGERYFLRLLLLRVKGPTSFEDLMTVDGAKCATFQEAALKLRLVEEDDTVELCLAEACEIHMPSSLRRLFATVLIFCQPKDPKALWSKYETRLCEDLTYRNKMSPAAATLAAAEEVERYLEAMGYSLTAFALDFLTEETTDDIHRTKDIVDALDAPVPEFCKQAIDQLNTGQRLAFTAIMKAVHEEKPGAFFVDGPGGTGKTFLYNALYAAVHSMSKIVLPTATSGIAASNIPSGRTAHSRFKIPIDVDASLACAVPKQGSLAALIREASLIIWDEASMARRENIESLDALLRDLCDPSSLFGGKVVVFGGDFRQVLPVVPNRSQNEVVAASLVASPIWCKLTRFRLTENIRAREDPEFSEFLLALGEGRLQSAEQGHIPLPQGITYLVREPGEQSIQTIAELTFPQSQTPCSDARLFTGSAILTSTNEDVGAINSTLIERFPGEAVTYRSFDVLLDDACNIYPTEFVNKLCPGGMSPHELVLKPECPIILLRNILPSEGLCNGTRLICKHFFPNLIECVITTGSHEGDHVLIPRVKLRPPSPTSYPFQFQRTQFPIKLSFAMTINKSQGQTLSKVAVYLPRPCFAHGQLYVALSRARKADKVTVISPPPPPPNCSGSIKNVMSYDVLRLVDII